MTKRTSHRILLLICLATTAPAWGAGIEQLSNGMIRLIEAISEQRNPSGTLLRFNQAKSLGCFNAEFEVLADSPQGLRAGLFARPAAYPAYVRFASASEADDREKDLRGMSIKVMGVNGEPLWGGAGEQDFLLNSHPALFVATPEDFYGFMQALYDDALWKFFLNPFDAHLKSLWVLFQARQHHTSPFDIRYWSTTPSRLGLDDTQVVKYSASPCSTTHSELPDELSGNYLRDNMTAHLKRDEVCFDFQVQRQTDPDRMPIEDASVAWDEEASPFVRVARLRIQDQPFTDEASLLACEQASFNPWQSLPEHKPLGRMNLVRRNVYAALADFRKGVNQRRKVQND